MIQTSHLCRNRVFHGRVPTKLARVDFVIDNEAVRGLAIEIKTPTISSAERLLLAMVGAFAANSPLSDGDEQVLSLP